MKTILTYIFILLSLGVFAQDSELKIREHSPHKASIYSAIIPGAGQVYNKKYWKAPIVWASLATTLYFARENNTNINNYQSAYIQRKNGGTDIYSDVYTDDQLITIIDFYERNRDVSYILTAVFYLLNIVDASVDAHLFDFDINDDLSLRAMPTILSNSNGQQPMLSFQINF